MMSNSMKSRRIPARSRGVALLTIFCCAFVFSCSWLPKSYRKTEGKLIRDVTTASRYKKKIGITVIPNFSTVKDQGLEKIFAEVLTKTIKSGCKNALIVTPDASDAGKFLTNPPTLANGVIDNFALSNDGRAEGYNAIVSGALTTVSTREERSGWWRWRKTRYYLRVLAFIDVYDPYDAAKSFSEPIFSEIKIKGDVANKFKSGQPIQLPALKQIVTEMAQNVGAKVCDVVSSRIWKGYVVTSAQKQVTLSCGENQGIRPGNVFEVYDSARTMESRDGEKYFVPGYKIGEIEVTQVRKNQSEAKILTQAPLPAGSVVIAKF